MDVVTIGESMVLFNPENPGPLRYNESFRRTIGGAESNVAIALARLGHKTGWISQLGNDEFGLYVRNYIRGEGVDTSAVKFNSSYSTAVFFKERNTGQDPKVYYYRQGSAASRMTADELDEEYLARAKYIHLTGITPALSSSCKETIYQVIESANKNAQPVIFDPNIRLKLWGKQEAQKVLCDIASRSEIVLPGLEEGELLTNEKTPEKIAEALLHNKTELVVVKLGAEGAYYATKEESAYIPGYEVAQIIDTAGAGDGFAAGVISGLLRGWDYHQAVRLGNRIGAFALTVAGDVEGYPYWSQIDPENNEAEILR